jgi:hypothetical protein
MARFMPAAALKITPDQHWKLDKAVDYVKERF